LDPVYRERFPELLRANGEKQQANRDYAVKLAVSGWKNQAILALAVNASLAVPAWAQGLDTSLDLRPDLFDVQMKPAGDNGEGIKEASFGSGLGFALSNSLLQLDMDYRVQSKLKESSSDADVSQRVGASLQSKILNDMLGLDANIRANSTLRDGGYVYSLAPGFSKSLADLGRLNVRYEYLLDKPGTDAEEQEKTAYSMGLRGATENGRLDWSGSYRSADVFGGVEQLQSTERVEFSSGLQLIPELRLEVSGHSLDETRFDGGLVNELYTETMLGAGFSWSPSSQYSVAFKVNSIDESRNRTQEVFGSGTVSWFPQRNMEFTLSYGDHLVDGARGVMFSTRIDLNDS
jgi:hypothetical protein